MDESSSLNIFDSQNEKENSLIQEKQSMFLSIFKKLLYIFSFLGFALIVLSFLIYLLSISSGPAGIFISVAFFTLFNVKFLSLIYIIGGISNIFLVFFTKTFVRKLFLIVFAVLLISVGFYYYISSIKAVISKEGMIKLIDSCLVIDINEVGPPDPEYVLITYIDRTKITFSELLKRPVYASTKYYNEYVEATKDSLAKCGYYIFFSDKLYKGPIQQPERSLESVTEWHKFLEEEDTDRIEQIIKQERFFY